MLSTNTTQKEKKYSLSTVLAWLYLKTIGRILPGRWNKWAENILHHNQVIVDNGVQTEIMSKNKTTQTKYDKIEGKNFQASSEFEGKKELEDKNKELNEELEGVNQALETFIGLCNNQAQQIKDLELESNVLKEEKEQLNSIIKELEKNYRELAEIAQKRGEEFLVQFKGKSEEILNLQKELIECSKEFANKTEMLSVEIKEKDRKIGSLTELNKVLEQKGKEIEDKNNAQQQTIIEKKKKIKEQEDLIKSFHENKDINKTVKKENESLRMQKTKLESKVSELNNESDTKIKELKNQLEEKQAELEKAKKKNTEVENLKQQLEKEKTNLNTIEKEKKELESEVDKLQEKSQKLEESNVEIKKQKADLEEKLKSSQGKNKKLQEQVEHLSAEQEKAKSVAVLSITDSTKTLNENLTSKDKQTEVSRPEGRQQKLKKEQKDAGKKLEDINKETKRLSTNQEIRVI